jgi:hypothetical protein
MNRVVNRSPNFRRWMLIPLLLMGTSCNDLLKVTDPDLLEKDDIAGAKGADLLWGGGLREFSWAFSGGVSGHALVAGLMSDEFHNVGPDGSMTDVDKRSTNPEDEYSGNAFALLHRARVATENAADFMEEINPADVRIAEMWSLNAYTHVMLAEDFCSGVPFSSMTLDGEMTLGEPMTTQEILEEAVSRFETARTRAGGNSDQENLARVGQARALLDLKRYAEAAQIVAPVPTEWSYAIYYGSAFWNSIQLNTQSRFSLSDEEGGTGLPFRSADDPRLPWVENGIGTNGQTPLFTQLKFPDRDSPVTLASGVEARYIEAEAALAAGNVAGFLGFLNELREALDMDPVSDPGTADGRIDLLFYERGFTLFGEGHRLGDLRRLVRQYGRAPNDVFPTGAYHLTGFFYGDDVNLDLPYAERDNPNFVGCLDRGA